MTVPASTDRNDHVGNGSTTTFPVGFTFLEDSHLAVYHTPIATGVTALLSDGVEYNMSGSDVVFVTAPATGDLIAILRDMPHDQNTDYIDFDTFPAESHEEAIDKLTMIAQQHKEVLDRIVVAPISEFETVDYTLPNYEAGKVLKWSTSDPKQIVNSDNDPDSAVNDAASSAAAAAASAAAALVSENNAASSESNAATSESNAATSETNAAASAAAAAGLITDHKAADNEYTSRQSIDEETLTSSSGAVAWDMSGIQVAKITLTENVTFSAPTNRRAGAQYRLTIVQDSTERTVSWNAVFQWEGGTPPVIPAGSGDIIIIMFDDDGTNLYGKTFFTEA